MSKTIMHRLAKEAIRRLRLEDIEPTLDEIIWLNNLANRTEIVVDAGLLLFKSKKVGNIEIYPMTIGARVWLLEIAFKWFSSEADQVLSDLSILYAYSNSRSPELFDFPDQRAARKAILKWAEKINSTEEEIKNAFVNIDEDSTNQYADVQGITIVLDLINQIKSNPQNLNLTKAFKYTKVLDESQGQGQGQGNKENTWSIPYIAMLMHYYPSKTEEQWLWDTSEDICFELLHQAQEMEKGEDDKGKADPNDPSILAFNEFQKALTYIRSYHAARRTITKG